MFIENNPSFKNKNKKFESIKINKIVKNYQSVLFKNFEKHMLNNQM